MFDIDSTILRGMDKVSILQLKSRWPASCGTRSWRCHVVRRVAFRALSGTAISLSRFKMATAMMLLALALPLSVAAHSPWQGVAAAVREELGSFASGQYPQDAAPTYEISTPNVDASTITDIHVVFSNHLDVGFNVRAWCDGPDGCVSPEDSKTGLPCRPWAYWVLNENINVFLPRAIETANAMRLLPPANATRDRYIYMSQPWVVSFFLDCENAGMLEWRNKEGGLGPSILKCPNASTVAKFTTAVKNGDIFWQAFPHNGQPGTYDASLFESSLAMGSRLSKRLGVKPPVCFSQRDETGMTRAILPLLNKAGVNMISLGSGGSSGGHPVIPDIFVWRDPASKAEVLFVHDHGYGGGMHVLPNGHAIYCAWNTDNGGPQKVNSVVGTFRSLRNKYPAAKVFSSTFEAFYEAAVAEPATMKGLPVVTQEIGDTWLYGCPSDPLKNVVFRELSRRRAACVSSGECNVEDEAMQRFDRLLTKIPEHTWGEDTTWYLHDYDNWTNPQINSAMHQENYNMTVESWREQRSYLTNAISVLERDTSGKGSYPAFGKSLRAALKAIEPSKPTPAASGFKPVSGAVTAMQQCGAVSLSFGVDGSLSSVRKDGKGWGGVLGSFRYQSLSSGNFTTFCEGYGNAGCKATTENPGCHNFHKPNMSSADPEYMVVEAQAQTLWMKTGASGGCTFMMESVIDDASTGGVHSKYGAPDTIITEVDVPAAAAAADTSSSSGSTSVSLKVTWLNKTTTRMAEASWVSFIPKVQSPRTGWQIYSLGVNVDPVDVVAHGAIHLHAMGPDGAMVYSGPDGNLSIASLDVPVVSTGILSPFPTMGTNGGDNSSIAATLVDGMHWNVQNNVNLTTTLHNREPFVSEGTMFDTNNC